MNILSPCLHGRGIFLFSFRLKRCSCRVRFKPGERMEQQLINSLLDVNCYPEPTDSVRHIQTHISHIFITDRLVYKIKKPVDFGFLDFSTLDKRKFFCFEEVRLNRRLSPDIYLGVVPLYGDGSGGLVFSGEGEPLEYAVMMRRLPEERMMSRLIERGEVELSDIEEVAKVVAGFHRNAERGGDIARFGSVEAIRENWLENIKQTERYIGRSISAKSHGIIAGWALGQIEEKETALQARVDGGFIRDCDGDLHSDNICLDGQVHIFDCIEFNERFRYGDTAADVAFLAMDMEFHERQDLSAAFVKSYIKESGDEGLLSVLSLYLANRALIRGKVESLRIDDKYISDAEKTVALSRSSAYLRLARGYAIRHLLPKSLFIACGPTGSGKSSLAAELCFQLGIRRVSSDIERKKLAGVPLIERGADIYGKEWNIATYERMAGLAEDELAAGRSLAVDATFRSHEERGRFARIAQRHGAGLVILFPVSTPELVRQRLYEREKTGRGESDGTWDIYCKQMTRFEKPSADEGMLITVDASVDREVMAENVLEALGLFDQFRDLG